jgi:hypothetical protein
MRRAGESAVGALLLTRLVVTGLLAALLVAGGVAASWDTARHATSAGSWERGALTLTSCDRDSCTGTLDGTGRTLELEQAVAREPGETLDVAVRPGTGEAVRTGLPGTLYGCLPLAGSLLLAAVVLAGGLRLYRTAWATAGVAVAALTATFALWI